MVDFLNGVGGLLDAYRGPLSAFVIAGLFSLPLLGLRAAARGLRRRRVHTLYADLQRTSRVWSLRERPGTPGTRSARQAPKRGRAVSRSLVAPHDDLTLIALPFENLITDHEKTALVEDLTRELATLIHQRPNIRVSQVTYGRDADATIGTPLPLDHPFILEGAVELVSDHALRMTVQILETATGERVYSDQFDGALGRTGPFLDEVAEAVAGCMASMMAIPNSPGAAQRPTDAPAAWGLYLRGEEVLRIGASRQRTDAAVRVFDHASRIDPGFAGSKNALGRALALRVLMLTSRDREADLARARAVLAAARELQPDAPERLVSEGLLLLADGDVRGAHAAFDEAARIDPTIPELRIFRRFAELVLDGAVSETADPLDPASFDGNGPKALARLIGALALAQQDRLKEAHRLLETTVTEASAFHLAWFMKGQVMALMARREDARGTFDRGLRVMGSRDRKSDRAALRTWIGTVAGNPARATTWQSAFDAVWR
ncbi:MAG: hypothetical protein ACFB6R_04390 [Alphaproteobacteria bacterium]